MRVAISNFLQKYRTLLLSIIVGGVLIVVALAIWTQIDASTKTSFAAKIEKSQVDYSAWSTETDATKKADLAKTLENELGDVQKNAPTGYGLSKAWFLQGNYWATQKRWPEAAKAYQTVFEKDRSSYLAPISLVNAGVCQEEAGDTVAALATYAEFEKNYATDPILGPQVFFTQGRLLETQQKSKDAVMAYQKLLDKFPDSGWTKLGRDRILLLSVE